MGVWQSGLQLLLSVANDTANRLLARIKQLREAKGLTQEAFAEKAGLAYKYYQHVEAGRRRDIRLSTLIKLADGLGLELSELVDFTAPVAVAEAPTKVGHQTAPHKGARKPAKRR